MRARKKWLRENRDHFKGVANLVRVQEWRKKHPGYWRRVRVGQYSLRGALADAVRQCALQDVIDTHFSLVVGLVSRLSGSALQNEIAEEMRQLMFLGHGIITQVTNGAADPYKRGV